MHINITSTGWTLIVAILLILGEKEGAEAATGSAMCTLELPRE